MSLNLDPRQRAMLREMGVRVWQPLTPVQPLSELPVAALAALPSLPEVAVLAVLEVLEPSSDAIDFVAGRAQETPRQALYDATLTTYDAPSDASPYDLFNRFVNLRGCAAFVQQKTALATILLNHAIADKAVAYA